MIKLKKINKAIPMGPPKVMVACKDCVHYTEVVLTPGYCTHPNLKVLLDISGGHQNFLIECNAARDFRVACGHEAIWFEPKVSQGE